MTDKLEVLSALAATVRSRRTASSETSYTARLLSEGIESCAKKVSEEAGETALAAVEGDRDHLRREVADLVYHLIVLLEAAELPLADVMIELERRVGIGGLVEKAARRGN